MQNINDLEQVLESLKALIKAKKDYEKLSAKYANVSFKDVTRSQRARINERLGDAAFDVKVKTDNLHADLVDAYLCDMKERYEQRELGQSAGLGHIYRAAYLPKVPKRYKELEMRKLIKFFRVIFSNGGEIKNIAYLKIKRG